MYDLCANCNVVPEFKSSVRTVKASITTLHVRVEGFLTTLMLGIHIILYMRCGSFYFNETEAAERLPESKDRFS